jgi:hypothetical protein
VVNALAVVSLDPVLKVGATTDTVTIIGEGSMLQTEDVALGTTMENAVYDALPLSMNKSARDPSAFVGLALGIENYSTQAAGPSTGSFSGGQPFQNETYGEGIPLTSAGTESDTRNLHSGLRSRQWNNFRWRLPVPRPGTKDRVCQTTSSGQERTRIMALFMSTSAIRFLTQNHSSPPPVLPNIRTNLERAWVARS